MSAAMNSRSGDRVPAGVSGQAGRGTVGTDAPTAPNDSTDADLLLSPLLWVLALGYAALGVFLVWLAVSLAPWGLLILLIAVPVFGAAILAGFIAFGVAQLEADPA